SLRTAAIVVENTVVDEERGREAASYGYLNATELADYLVKQGMPFRAAHEAVGKLVLIGLDGARELGELSLEEMRLVVPEIGEGVYEALKLEQALGSKAAIGGTAPSRVYEALKTARELIE